MALKEFRMRGSAADVEMRGEVDLARETQDLRVRVIPSLGRQRVDRASRSSTRWPASPAAIAQRMLKNPLGQIFAFDYAVTGTLDRPEGRRKITRAAARRERARSERERHARRRDPDGLGPRGRAEPRGRRRA